MTKGVITDITVRPTLSVHAFLRNADGSCPSWSRNFPSQYYTIGSITGFFRSPNTMVRAFERRDDYTFDPSGSIDTLPISISSKVQLRDTTTITKMSFTAFCVPQMEPISSFDVAGFVFTEALSIDKIGTITGHYSEWKRAPRF